MAPSNPTALPSDEPTTKKKPSLAVAATGGQ
eukprot:CAMPEP_0170111108 /NCGR_PEP_ID=MMETSP0020_2-20130122/8281_1 /TAXON_ID=98059 /ORGANISM="Dinobryon sp., Strain UTEXLB2267" /LENGTH=30 /DNA_ID= /DNA_START= /DNA_END= /DNA_ORIENTATION=